MRCAAVILCALALAGTAGAKGPASASVCGSSGCRSGDPALLNPVDGRPFMLASKPRPAPHYVVFLSAPGEYGFCWRIVWVPARRVLRLENLRPYVPGDPVAGRLWRTVDPSLARRLERGTRGIRPFAAARAWRQPAARCAG